MRRFLCGPPTNKDSRPLVLPELGRVRSDGIEDGVGGRLGGWVRGLGWSGD